MKPVLTKLIKTTYIPGYPGHPGSPGQPYRPGRWETRTRQECSYSYSGQMKTECRPDYSLGGSGQTICIQVPVHGNGYSQQKTCKTVKYQVWIPAQSYIPPTPPKPAIPSQTLQDFNLGWTGKARSIQQFLRYGQVKFKVPRSAVGVVIGLSKQYQERGYSNIQYALNFSHGVAQVMLAGQLVHYIGLYAEDDEWTIRRTAGTVFFLRNGTEVYQTANSDGPYFLEAALYSGGDSVLDPEISSYTEGEGALQPMYGSGYGMALTLVSPTLDGTTPASLQPLHGYGWGSVATGGIGASSFQPMYSISMWDTYGDVELRPLHGLGGDYAYGQGFGTIHTLLGGGSADELEPAYAVGVGWLQNLTSTGVSLTGEVASGSNVLEGLIGLGADRFPYGQGAASFESLFGYGENVLAEDEVLIFSSVFGALFSDARGEVFVVLHSNGSAVTLISVQDLHNALLTSEASVLTDFQITEVINAVLYSLGVGSSMEQYAGLEADTWAVTLGGGSTRYSNFNFNSFMRVAGRVYGVKPDGLYLLEGEDDAGTPVQAVVSVGTLDFGTNVRKRLKHCYVAASSSGKVFLKVVVDGEEYLYSSRDIMQPMKTERIDVGRGLCASHYTFELYNSDGADFDLNTLEFQVLPLTRRV